MKLGRRYVPDMLEMNPYEEIKPYPGSTRIVYGTQDDIVYPDYARRAYETYHSRLVGKVLIQLHMVEGGE